MNIIICLLIGLAGITFIDVLGAIASRKLSFKYVKLISVSLLFYIYMGYLVSKNYGLAIAFVINNLIGFYDATVGLRLSIILKANANFEDSRYKQPLNGKIIFSMLIIASALSILGFEISRI